MVAFRRYTLLPLTDNGIQFADLPRNRYDRTARLRVHHFDQICREHGIRAGSPSGRISAWRLKSLRIHSSEAASVL